MNKIIRFSPLFIIFAFLLFTNYHAFANQNTKIELKVKNEIREALIYYPLNAKDVACPVIIVFHGHGGSMQNAVTQFECKKYWPESIVVYPQCQRRFIFSALGVRT